MEESLAPFEAPAAQLVTASSHLIDRIVPDCEIVALPAKTVAGGQLRYGAGLIEARSGIAPPRRARVLGRKTAPRRAVEDGVLLDLRHHAPDNWAHFLTNHVPLAFRLCALLELDWAELRLVLPANIPAYIRDAAAVFGLQVIASDDILTGQGVMAELGPWTALRPTRAAWVQTAPVQARLAQLEGAALPARVFLARRDSRAVSNMQDIDPILAKYGFVTLYPEDLSAADQFRLFRAAETIVAVHGAGLAPLLYRPGDGRLRQLVELLPCGHMTDVYRVMCAQVGCAWIGVRGRLKPEYIRPAYDLSQPYTQHSLDNFELDPVALERAFGLMKHPL